MKSSNEFTALSIGWVEINLGRVTLDFSPRIGLDSDFHGSYVMGDLALHIASRLLIEQPSHQLLPCITQARTTLER